MGSRGRGALTGSSEAYTKRGRGRPRRSGDARIIEEAQRLAPQAWLFLRGLMGDPKAEPLHKLRAAALILEMAARTPAVAEDDSEARPIRVELAKTWRAPAE